MKVKTAHVPDPIASHNTPPKITQLSYIPGRLCPSRISDAAAAHNDNAYFAKEYDVHEFNVPTKDWTKKIPCQQALFGMTVIENELTLVGGVVESGESVKKEVATNKVACWQLSISSEQKSWHDEKYPAMGTARIYPEVVATGKYLIALGGWTGVELEGWPWSKRNLSTPTTSVEILDLEEKRWYSNDRISLPEVFATMKWQSACICNKNLFIAVEHDDPKFGETMRAMRSIETEGDDSWDLMDEVDLYNNDLTLREAYPCFSMYCCSLETLVQMTKDEKECNKDYCWQKLSHPHPSVYKRDSPVPVDLYLDPESVYSSYKIPCPYFRYGRCCFTLSCINDHTIIAVGCKHVKSITKDDVQSSLYEAYASFREIMEIIRRDNDGDRMHNADDVQNDDDDGNDTIQECHIYRYNLEDDSWTLLKSIPKNGSPRYQPSVAIVGQKIVIMRNSETVHICTGH